MRTAVRRGRGCCRATEAIDVDAPGPRSLRLGSIVRATDRVVVELARIELDRVAVLVEVDVELADAFDEVVGPERPEALGVEQVDCDDLGVGTGRRCGSDDRPQGFDPAVARVAVDRIEQPGDRRAFLHEGLRDHPADGHRGLGRGAVEQRPLHRRHLDALAPDPVIALELSRAVDDQLR